MKKVSVIVPAYNVENYIRKTIYSITGQSYSELEIIIVDDGSTDGTPAIIDELATADNRIIAVHQVNQGVSNTRNNALELATGDYIAFVDSDDYIDADMIEKLVSEMESDNIDMLNFQYVREDESGKVLDEYSFSEGVYDISDEEGKINLILNEILPYHLGFEVWDKFFRRSIIQDNNIRFCPTGKIGEDLGFVYSYIAKADSIKGIKLRPYHYLIRENSAMSTADRKDYNLKQYLEFLSFVNSKWTTDRFYLIGVYTAENAMRELNDVQIASVVKESDRYNWYCQILMKAIADKNSFDKNMRRHLLCIADELDLLRGPDKAYIRVYDLYRSFRRREKYRLLPHV